MEKFQNKYRIQSNRMPGWDYSNSGKYYVTICTRKKICCFGDIKNGEMILNEMGRIANDFWLEIPSHFPYTWLDAHVVMPNHIHGIIVMKRLHVKNVNFGNVHGLGDVHDLGDVETLHATSLHTNNPIVLLACCDCTGHGVPGAFMSMLCTALLNEAVNDKGITKPNEIFDEVRKGIISALKQRGQAGGTKDGMDATIITLEFRNVETLHATSLLHTQNSMILHAACANNPVYIASNGSFTEIPPDRFPVGVYEGEQKPFTCHEVEVKKGDMIYTVTDGFEDQLGGAKSKKFKSAKLKELLITISSKPFAEQKEILEKAFEEWKGKGEQTDDVTIIGIKI